MPKSKKPLASRLRQYVSEYGNKIFRTDGKVIVCQICEKQFVCEQKNHIKQHVNSVKHKNLLNRQQEKQCEKQLFIGESLEASSSNQSQFNTDLCQTLLDANIPFNKI